MYIILLGPYIVVWLNIMCISCVFASWTLLSRQNTPFMVGTFILVLIAWYKWTFILVLITWFMIPVYTLLSLTENWYTCRSADIVYDGVQFNFNGKPHLQYINFRVQINDLLFKPSDHKYMVNKHLWGYEQTCHSRQN